MIHEFYGIPVLYNIAWMIILLKLEVEIDLVLKYLDPHVWIAVAPGQFYNS